MKYHVGVGCSFGCGKGNPHQLIAEKLGAELTNLSKPGGGNYRIYAEILSWIALNPHKLHDVTFSVGWSGMYRNDLIADRYNQEVAPSKQWGWTRWRADEEDDVANALPRATNLELDHTVRFYTLISSLQNLFAKHGVKKYIMWNSIDNNIDFSVFDIKSRTILQAIKKTQIDRSKFFDFEKSQSVFTAENNYFKDPSPVSIKEKITRFPTGGTQYGVRDNHPSLEGNLKWIDLIWKLCSEHKIFDA